MRVAFVDDDPNELKILHTYFNDLTDSSTISIDDSQVEKNFCPALLPNFMTL